MFPAYKKKDSSSNEPNKDSWLANRSYKDTNRRHSRSRSRSRDRSSSTRQKFPKDERSERSKMLHILSDKKRRAFNERFIGSKKEVLYEHSKNGLIYGYSDNYIRVKVDEPIHIINTVKPTTLQDISEDAVNGVI